VPAARIGPCHDKQATRTDGLTGTVRFSSVSMSAYLSAISGLTCNSWALPCGKPASHLSATRYRCSLILDGNGEDRARRLPPTDPSDESFLECRGF